MRSLFDDYMLVVFFIYGLSFFFLGTAISLKSNRGSALGLARHLWLLAAFGLLHAFAEWSDMLLALGENYWAPESRQILRIASFVLCSLSFLALLQFGVRVILRRQLMHRWLYAVCSTMILLLIAMACLDGISANSQALMRYLVALPATSLAALALFQYARLPEVQSLVSRRLSRNIAGTAIVFGLYTFFAAIVVPKGTFFPASFLNQTMFFEIVGVPVQVFRAGCAITLSYFVLGMMAIFDQETTHTLETAHFALQESHKMLELRVQQRTVELASTNAALEADIHAHQQREVELREAKHAAEAGTRARSEFLANMSHEIRTPMNGILGMIDLTLRAELPPRQRDFLNLAKSSAEALLRLLNDILDLSKIEAGRLELESIDFSLRKRLSQTLRTLAMPAEQKGLELTCAISPNVPDSLVGDAGRLSQIVVNLVGNATKFTEHGEVAVRVDGDEAAGESVLLHVTIRDTGIGVSPEKHEHIFAAFSQADSSMTRQYGGTGLGLTICSHLVKSMGGRIWMESELGRGSTFHFSARFGLGKQPSSAALAPAYRVRWAGLRVLVVDDNSTNRILLQELLNQWGLQPTLVGDGPTALASLRKSQEAGEPFRLVLLDAQMPGMDGFAVAEQIHCDAGLSGTAVMMLSSIDRPSELERGKELGIRVYLRKPISESDLLESILSVLGISTEAQAEPGIPPLPPATCLLRVLLAEDTPVNQRLVRALLEERGHTIVIANDGKEAIEILARESFDLILMDVQMPRMDGYQATAAIRAREESTGQHIPIIAMTAHSMKGDRERCLAAGMDGYISKPIQAEQFIALVEGQTLEAGNHSTDASQDIRRKTGGVVFDQQEALSRAKGKQTLLQEMAELVLADCPGLLAQIRAALATSDHLLLEQAAHRLQGSAANLSAPRVVEVARRLEDIGREGDLAKADAVYLELEDEVRRLESALQAFLREQAVCES